MFVGLIFLCYIYYLVRFNFGCFQIILLRLSKKVCTLVKVVVHLCWTKGQWNVDLQMLQVHVSYFSLSTLWFIFIYLLYTFIVAYHWSCRDLLFGIKDPDSRWNLIFYVFDIVLWIIIALTVFSHNVTSFYISSLSGLYYVFEYLN